MIGTLLRAAGGAASFTLGSLWPMRWPAFPVAFFDFDMFNEPADRLWEESKERYAREARALEAQARELAAQTAIPQTVMANTVTVYDRFIAAVIAGDLGTAIELADEFCTQFGQDLADLLGIDLTSSAAGEASDIGSPRPHSRRRPRAQLPPPRGQRGATKLHRRRAGRRRLRGTASHHRPCRTSFGDRGRSLDAFSRKTRSRSTFQVVRPARCAPDGPSVHNQPRERNVMDKPDAPPTAVVYRDEQGPMIRTSPFGHSDGMHLSISIERWRQWNAIVEQAVAESVSLRLAGASL